MEKSMPEVIPDYKPDCGVSNAVFYKVIGEGLAVDSPKYKNEEDARKEALRLADLHRGTPFYTVATRSVFINRNTPAIAFN